MQESSFFLSRRQFFFCACAPAESVNVQESYRTGEIPEVYEAQRGKVTFRMDVTIPEAALDCSFTEAKATALKAEEEAACSAFLEGRKVETIQEGRRRGHFVGTFFGNEI